MTSAAFIVLLHAPATLMKIGTLTSATMMQKPTSRLTPLAAERLRLEKMRQIEDGIA